MQQSSSQDSYAGRVICDGSGMMIGMKQSVIVMTTVMICISMALAGTLYSRLQAHIGPDAPLPNVSTMIFIQATLGIFGDLDFL